MKSKITTSDIYFVAALITTGAKIDKENVDRTDPRHIRFTVSSDVPVYTFSSKSIPETASITSVLVGLEYYEDLWDTGKMMVNAVAYKNALQQVKTLIHSTIT